MQKYGINKRLRDRRLELDYSVREACIRLDISKRKLYLIEFGYIKVKSPLKEKFIRKYKLDEHFFDDDFKGYPTLIFNEPKKKKKRPKLSKFFRSWQFKVGALALMGGFIAMSVIGLTGSPRLTNDTPSFFSERVNTLKDYVKSTTDPDEQHSAAESRTSLLIDDYYSMSEYKEEKEPEQFYYVSINFFKHDEYEIYTFLKCLAVFDVKIEGVDFGHYIFEYESRMCGTVPRIHLYIYPYTESEIEDYGAHISADVDRKSGAIRYNLVEARAFDDSLVQIKSDRFEYYIYTYMFANHWADLFRATNEMFLNKKQEGKINVTYDEFYTDFVSGINNYERYSSRCSALSIWGLVLAVVCLALALMSCLKSFKWGMKISDREEPDIIHGGTAPVRNVDSQAVVMATEKVQPLNTTSVPSKASAVRAIPYNSWPCPIIPEMAIRILSLLIALFSSIGIFYIFQGLLSFDVDKAIAGLALKAEISSLAPISMLLLLLTKLDIRQSKKNTFVINFILFFAGLIFYIFTLMIQYTMLSSKILSNSVYILNYLPGNVVWGVLAFNLLSAALFSQPKFKNPTKGKLIAYRSLAILPTAYLVISCIYSIGKNAWGWNWPLAISSFFFSNALITAAFSILYSGFVFCYKTYTVKKFGYEGAAIYQTSNRYFFIKNLVVAGVVAIIGIIDVIVGKCAPNNPVGLGNNYLIFVTIPFILLYHPHMGQRNKKWDIGFFILYVLFMVLGYILIASNLSVYITSL